MSDSKINSARATSYLNQRKNDERNATQQVMTKEQKQVTKKL